VLNVGDVLKVRVLEVLKEERKVKLSMKGVAGNESLSGHEPGQETPPVETGSDTGATDSTFVEPAVVVTEAPAVENIEPEVVEPEVVEPEAPAVENIEPEVVETEVPVVENVETALAEPVSTEEVAQHEETEGPAEA
jgi:hypothetical protein